MSYNHLHNVKMHMSQYLQNGYNYSNYNNSHVISNHNHCKNQPIDRPRKFRLVQISNKASQNIGNTPLQPFRTMQVIIICMLNVVESECEQD